RPRICCRTTASPLPGARLRIYEKQFARKSICGVKWSTKPGSRSNKKGDRMRKTIVSSALAISAFAAYAQDDCANMANRWSDIFTNAPALEQMTALFQPNALVFGTLSKELGTKTEDVVAYFTPVYARKVRTKNSIKSQSVIQAGGNVWIIAGLYEFA